VDKFFFLPQRKKNKKMEAIALAGAVGLILGGMNRAGNGTPSVSATPPAANAVTHEATYRGQWFDSVYYNYPARFSPAAAGAAVVRGTSYAPTDEWTHVYHNNAYRTWANTPSVRHAWQTTPTVYPDRNVYDKFHVPQARIDARRVQQLNTQENFVPLAGERATGGNQDRMLRRVAFVNNPNSVFSSTDRVIPSTVAQGGVYPQL